MCKFAPEIGAVNTTRQENAAPIDSGTYFHVY